MFCKIYIIAVLFGITAISAYEVPSLQVSTAYLNPGFVGLVKKLGDKEDTDVRFSGPKLTGQWTPLSYRFIPLNDGWVRIMLGPSSQDNDVPFYFRDIKIRGKLSDLDAARIWPTDSHGAVVACSETPGWLLLQPASTASKVGCVTSVPGLTPQETLQCLQLYNRDGAYLQIAVKKKEPVEVTLLARSGSVLEAYRDKLALVTENLNEAIRIITQAPDNADQNQSAGVAFAKTLNDLIALSQAHLNISISPLTPDTGNINALKAKSEELSLAYEKEISRSFNDPVLCISDKLESRKIVGDTVQRLVNDSSDLITSMVITLIFSR